jgi:hypothetical protein
MPVDSVNIKPHTVLTRSKWSEIPRKLVQLGDFDLKIETLKASFFGLWLGIGLIYAKN